MGAPLELGGGTVTADQTVVTTAETLAVAGPEVGFAPPDATLLVMGWVQVAVGANGAGVTARLRRGADATGTLVSTGDAQNTILPAQTFEVFVMAVETRSKLDTVRYALTVQVGSATGNSTIKQAGIAYFVF